jgi:hypothetical protein
MLHRVGVHYRSLYDTLHTGLMDHLLMLLLSRAITIILVAAKLS